MVHGGSYALRHSATDNSGYITSQTFYNVVPNARYRFGAWVNIPATTDTFSFALQVRWRDINTNTISVYTVRNLTAATNGWEFVTADLVARPGTASVKVEMPRVAGLIKLPLTAVFEAKGEPAVWVVDKAVPPDLRARLRDTFLSLSESDPTQARVLSLLNTSAFLPASVDDYADLVALMRRMQMFESDLTEQ